MGRWLNLAVLNDYEALAAEVGDGDAQDRGGPGAPVLEGRVRLKGREPRDDPRAAGPRGARAAGPRARGRPGFPAQKTARDRTGGRGLGAESRERGEVGTRGRRHGALSAPVPHRADARTGARRPPHFSSARAQNGSAVPS